MPAPCGQRAKRRGQRGVRWKSGAMGTRCPMGSRRDAMVGKHEAMFRAANERVAAWPERRHAPATDRLIYFCECGHPKCSERVYLTRPEYEAIRAHPAHFVVALGHVFPEVERVVERHVGYAVVEKHEDVRAIVDRTDAGKPP